MNARVKAARRGRAVFRGAQQAKEGGEDRGEEHDSVASREVAANVRTQKDQGGNCDRSPRRSCEAVGLGALEAAQHKPERMHTRHLRREAETEAEMLQPCQVRAEVGHGKAHTRRATNSSSTNSWREDGWGIPTSQQKARY